MMYSIVAETIEKELNLIVSWLILELSESLMGLESLFFFFFFGKVAMVQKIRMDSELTKNPQIHHNNPVEVERESIERPDVEIKVKREPDDWCPDVTINWESFNDFHYELVEPDEFKVDQSTDGIDSINRNIAIDVIEVEVKTEEAVVVKCENLNDDRYDISLSLLDYEVPSEIAATTVQVSNDEVDSGSPKSCEGRPAHEYPRRSVKKVNYAEAEMSIDDNFNCHTLTNIGDIKVTMAVDDRSRKALPAGVLEIKTSMHGKGVVAMKTLPKGVRFGPCEGVKLAKKPAGYAWLLKNGKLVLDEGNSNWMRYINCARNANEQNLTAFQCLGKLYYRTARRVEIEEELLVFYGEKCAEVNDIDDHFEPEIVSARHEHGFACRPCGYVFSEEKYLLGHNRVCRMGILENLETFVCKYCRVKVSDSKLFDDHVELCKWTKSRSSDSDTSSDEEAVSRKMFKCNECSYQTNIKAKLIPHFRVHTGEQPYACDDCGKRFTRKDSLDRHKSAHSEERNFRCNYCNKTFGQRRKLDRHINLHSTVRPFKCTDCDRGYNRKQDLKYHRMSRHEQRQYRCDQCEYSVFRKDHLIRHKMIHGNVKPYKCEECDYGSVTASHLKRHMRRHTGEKPYKCTLCGYSCAHSNALTQHIKHKHNVDGEVTMQMQTFFMKGDIEKRYDESLHGQWKEFALREETPALGLSQRVMR